MTEQLIISILYVLMGSFFWYKIEKLSEEGKKNYDRKILEKKGGTMMCELKQAQHDIKFLQECNNSVNLALSVTRKQLAAANARVAELESSLKMKEEHEEVYKQAIEVGERLRKQNKTATWEERHAVLKPRYMARSQEENVDDLLSTIMVSENRAREREIYRERLCAVKDALAGEMLKSSRLQQHVEQAKGGLGVDELRLRDIVRAVLKETEAVKEADTLKLNEQVAYWKKYASGYHEACNRLTKEIAELEAELKAAKTHCNLMPDLIDLVNLTLNLTEVHDMILNGKSLKDAAAKAKAALGGLSGLKHHQ